MGAPSTPVGGRPPNRGRALRRLLAVAAPLALVGATSLAMAPPNAVEASGGAVTTSQRTVGYPVDHVWSATIRHLRVDRSFSITDRDREAGFILFEVPSQEPRPNGSIELVSAPDDGGRVSARITVRVVNGPSFLPHALAEGIESKVRDERGPPPSAPQEPPSEDEEPEEDPHGLPMVPPAIDP